MQEFWSFSPLTIVYNRSVIMCWHEAVFVLIDNLDVNIKVVAIAVLMRFTKGLIYINWQAAGFEVFAVLMIRRVFDYTK